MNMFLRPLALITLMALAMPVYAQEEAAPGPDLRRRRRLADPELGGNHAHQPVDRTSLLRG